MYSVFNTKILRNRRRVTKFFEKSNKVQILHLRKNITWRKKPETSPDTLTEPRPGRGRSRGGWSPPLPKMTPQSSSLWRRRFGSPRRRQEALAVGSRPGCSRWQRSGAGRGVRSGCRQLGIDRRPGDRWDRWWERWVRWWWGREASGFGCRLVIAQRTRYCSPAHKEIPMCY